MERPFLNFKRRRVRQRNDAHPGEVISDSIGRAAGFYTILSISFNAVLPGIGRCREIDDLK